MSSELLDFTHQALGKGKTKKEVADVLKKAGWIDEAIKIALNSFADVEFPVPVPRPKPHASARETFLYLVMFSALYCSCYHAGSVIFDLINMSFPDIATDHIRMNFRSSYQDSIRWSISALVVSLPVFFFTFRLINKEIVRDPARRNSRPRKWLTYLTLFIVTMTLMSDVGTLVYNVLAGEITTRFVLKVLTVIVIAGGNFVYFLRDMRSEEIV